VIVVTTFAAVFAANFAFIFLKAFQQRNVIHNNFGWVLIVSNTMALFEVYVVASIAKHGVDGWLVVALGMGGGLGCVAAMALHNRYMLKGVK
jgi:hypothetical protein